MALTTKVFKKINKKTADINTTERGVSYLLFFLLDYCSKVLRLSKTMLFYNTSNFIHSLRCYHSVYSVSTSITTSAFFASSLAFFFASNLSATFERVSTIMSAMAESPQSPSKGV